MNMSNLLSIEFDADFRQCRGLTWLPWVGASYTERPQDQRILIVGESHYVRPARERNLAEVIQEHLSYENYTRDVVSECLIHQEWPNRTLDTLPKLLFGTSEIDRELFWCDTAYYNFVQSPMHYNREGSPERPSWESFVDGWGVFLQVVSLLRPSYCLFIGVAAFDSFNHVMSGAGVEHEEVQRTEKISRTYGRRASLHIDFNVASLIGIQHLGKYCSWSRWHDYLIRNHQDIVAILGSRNYATKAHPS